MNCYLHPDREATAYCRTCGRALCTEDQRDIHGVIYCQDCLARQMNIPGVSGTAGVPPLPPITPAVPGAPSPGVALALGFIPGVGAIYNGQYVKAFVQVLILGFLIHMSNYGGSVSDLFGIGVAAFWFYMVIDSYRTARALSLGQPVEDLPGMGKIQINAPIGALILLAGGGLLLLQNLGWQIPNFSRFFWPAVMIAVGVLLLRRQQHPRGQ